MEVKTTVSVNPGIIRSNGKPGLVDHYNSYNKTPIKKEAAYPHYGYTGRVMQLVIGDKWADSSIFMMKRIPVRVIGEYENFIVLEALRHGPMNQMSENFTTTINKHDIYRGRVNLLDLNQNEVIRNMPELAAYSFTA